jgi:preprotein translocase subunit SecG
MTKVHFLHIAFFFQFTAGKNIFQMLGDDAPFFTKKLADSLLRKFVWLSGRLFFIVFSLLVCCCLPVRRTQTGQGQWKGHRCIGIPAFQGVRWQNYLFLICLSQNSTIIHKKPSGIKA